ncbi:Gfo/Idh/MocA family protein [Paenibacillus eucommiae]|uniref:Dehydrogenase n=1 Tax=Paenibacillus eucommiae TaxID=1355755 RepID=A0ABS4ITE8_9BACL|nr:Gfo/Idh/MocA family oxidoreductase [Paenibacillus eucommiae]MBP1990828.1 putative dehydrogenase [Paenibacillus eucommiae]
MKVAIVGGGGMGRQHLEVYRLMKDVEVVAVVDPDVENVRSLINDDSIAIYASLDELLACIKINMVDICAPTYLHCELAIQAMEQGIHVICEKPISLTVDEASEMNRVAECNQVQFMVAQVIRFWPEYQHLKQVFDEQTYGTLLQLQMSRISPTPHWSWDNWMLNREKSGGCPLDLHIHDTDFILHLLGKPKSVTSIESITDGIMDYLSTQYEYDGMLVQAEAGFYAASIPFTMSFNAVFEKATLQYKNYRLTTYEHNKEPIVVDVTQSPGETLEEKKAIQAVHGYYNEIRYFLDCLNENKHPSICTPDSSMESLKIVYKELESAAAQK